MDCLFWMEIHAFTYLCWNKTRWRFHYTQIIKHVCGNQPHSENYTQTYKHTETNWVRKSERVAQTSCCNVPRHEKSTSISSGGADDDRWSTKETLMKNRVCVCLERGFCLWDWALLALFTSAVNICLRSWVIRWDRVLLYASHTTTCDWISLREGCLILSLYTVRPLHLWCWVTDD